MDIIMIGEAVVFVIFIIFNCGPNVFKNAAEDAVILNRMKEIELTLAVLDEEGSEYEEGGIFVNVDKKNQSFDDAIPEEPEMEIYDE